MIIKNILLGAVHLASEVPFSEIETVYNDATELVKAAEADTSKTGWQKLEGIVEQLAEKVTPLLPAKVQPLVKPVVTIVTNIALLFQRKG